MWPAGILPQLHTLTASRSAAARAAARASGSGSAAATSAAANASASGRRAPMSSASPIAPTCSDGTWLCGNELWTSFGRIDTPLGCGWRSRTVKLMCTKARSYFQPSLSNAFYCFMACG
eukprot:361689-Chlamydomonas_euryale.AAC.5